MDISKIIAIVGAGREGLSLLPFLLDDKSTRLVMIADNNREAMAFKLGVFGYKIADRFNITLTSDLQDLKSVKGLNMIVNASLDPEIASFLTQPVFHNIEVLSPLSARLIWSYKSKEGKITEGIKGTTKEKQVGLLESLAEIVDAVKLTMDKKELLSLILKLALDSTGADKGSLMLVDNDEGSLKIEIAEGMEEEIMRKVNIPIGEGIAGWVAKEGKPIVIKGRATDPRFKNLKQRTDVRSALCVPLIVEGKTIGVLNVSSSSSVYTFTKDDFDFLTKLAAFDAEIIQRSREYEEMKFSSIKFNLWKEIEHILAQTLPIEERLNKVCDRLAGFIEDLSCSIYLYDEYSKRLSLRASTMSDIENRGPISLGLKDGIGGWVARERKPTVLVERDSAGDTYRKYYLSFPLISDNDFLMGVMEGQLVSSIGLPDYQEAFLREVTTLVADSIKGALKNHRISLRSTKLSEINRLGLEIVTASDQGMLLPLIVSSAVSVMDSKVAVLRLRDPMTNRYIIKAIHGLDRKRFKKDILPFEKDVSLNVLQNKTPVIEDINKEKRKGIRVGSFLSYPLKTGDTLLGVITLFDKIEPNTSYPAPFEEGDIDLLSQFMRFSEKALTNIVLNERVRMIEGSENKVLLNTRNFFERRVKEELNRAKRYGRQLLLMLVEVKNYDVLVARFGEDKALETLRELNNLVEQRIRSFDVVADLEGGLLGILFPDSDAGALRVVDQIVRIEKEEIELKVGYAIYPDDAKDYDELMERAQPS
ncbi:MAG: GAF domain-containing protein [Thermodesulfobacteriota bacterium]